jgi:AraC family transcriptional activator FtrA
MARQVGMSTRTLARRFSETAGTSPAEWVTGLRLIRAKQLLEATRHNVEEIATECGFGSAATLRHHFRERFKTSPGSYRWHFRVR